MYFAYNYFILQILDILISIFTYYQSVLRVSTKHIRLKKAVFVKKRTKKLLIKLILNI